MSKANLYFCSKGCESKFRVGFADENKPIVCRWTPKDDEDSILLANIMAKSFAGIER